jgi:hypothetical protein
MTERKKEGKKGNDYYWLVWLVYSRHAREEKENLTGRCCDARKMKVLFNSGL